jgi:hypothetical protein
MPSITEEIKKRNKAKIVNGLKGQSHEKMARMRVWGNSLGPN